LGLLGAGIDAWDVSALRVRAAAIVMVVAVSAGLAGVNPTAAKHFWALIPFVHWAAEHRHARSASPGGRPARPAGNQ
jgi:hypothetical protein